MVFASLQANINMAFDKSIQKALGTTQSQAYMRLPIQFLFAAWVYQMVPASC